MTNDEAAFLRTICEFPADDTPRLVFADWLEEQGDADRAEFIRLQIALARRDSAIDRDEAIGRCNRLLRTAAYRSEWYDYLKHEWLHQQGVDRFRSSYGKPNSFHRGFVRNISLDSGDFSKYAAAIFRLHPITDVCLRDKMPWQLSGNDHSWFPPNAIPHSQHFGLHCLPQQIYDCLPQTESHIIIEYDYPVAAIGKRFNSVAAACNALSLACVHFGRTLQTPPLPTTTPAEPHALAGAASGHHSPG